MKNCKPVYKGKKYESIKEIINELNYNFNNPKSVENKKLSKEQKHLLIYNDNSAYEMLEKLSESDTIINMDIVHQSIHVNNMAFDLIENFLNSNKKTVLDSISKKQFKKQYISSITNSKQYKNKDKIIKLLTRLSKEVDFSKPYDSLQKYHNIPNFLNYYNAVNKNKDFLKNRIKDYEQYEENLTILEENFEKLFKNAISKLKGYNLISYKKEEGDITIERNDNAHLNIRTNFEDDVSFKIDSRDKLTGDIKKLLIGIDFASDYKIINDTAVPIPVAFLGKTRKMPFDILYNELSSLLAFTSTNYKNFRNIKADNIFNEFIEVLEINKYEKPYLISVINKLKKLNESQKLAFVTNFSKSAINHNTTFEILNTTNFQGLPQTTRNLLSRKTNAIQSVKILLKSWQNNILNSPLVKEVTEDETIIFDENEVESFEKRLNNSYSVIQKDINLKLSNRLEEERTIKGRDLLIGEKKKIVEEVKILNKEQIEHYKELFSFIGIDINDDAIQHLYKYGYNVKDGNIKLNIIHNVSTGVFKTFLNHIKNKEGELIKINLNQNNIFNDNYIIDFGKFLTRYEHSKFALSYSDALGKSFYGVTLNKFLSDRFKDLKTKESLIKNLLKNNFSQDSYILEHLYDKNKGEFIESNFDSFFDYFFHSANSVKNNKNFNSNYLRYSSKYSYDKVAVNYFMNKNNKTKDNAYKIKVFGKTVVLRKRNVKYLLPPFSDKHLIAGVNALSFSVDTLNENDKLDTNNSIIDLLVKEVFMPEYKRMFNNQKEDYESINNNQQVGSNIFYFLPELNTSKGNFLFDETGKLKDISNDAESQQLLKEVILENIEKKFKKTKESFQASEILNKKGNFIYKDKDYPINSPNNFIYEYAINYFINNVNFYKLFVNDPAQYYKGDVNLEADIKSVESLIKEGRLEENESLDDIIYDNIKKTVDNINKRLAGIIAPGNDIIPETKNETTNFLVLKDVEDYGENYFNNKGLRVSISQDYYKRLLGKDSYSSMASGDAMGYVIMEEFLDIERKRGHITKTQKSKILSFEKKDNLSQKEFKEYKKIVSKTLLNSQKPIYYNSYWNGKEMETLYVKYSSLPLSKHLTQGTDLDNLRKLMEKHGIKNAVFSSAVKVGSPKNLLEIFDKDGNIKDDINIKTINSSLKNSVPRQGHKIQLDNPIEKKEVTDASQHKKLLFADILDVEGIKQKRDEMYSLYDELYREKFFDFKEEIGFDEETNTFNKAKLQEVIKREIEERGFPPSSVSFIGLDENGNFKQPLWSSNFSSKIESILVGLVSNRLIKHKTNGFNPILASSLGFKFKKIKKGDDATNFIRNNSNIIFDKEWAEDESNPDNILRPQRMSDDGKTVLPAEVMISNNFYYYDDKGIKQKLDISKFIKNGYLDTNKIPKELLEAFAYRIPTQSLSSMSYVKIVGILPDTYSEMILAPSEFTTQMGSDFDIDKLFFNIKNFNITKKIKKGKSNEFEEEQEINFKDLDVISEIENKILDIKLSVVSNPNEKIQNKILSPLDENLFENLTKEIEDLYNEKEEFFSYDYNREKYFKSLNGSSSIGVFANASTLHASMQGDVTYEILDKKGNKIYISIGKGKDGKLIFANKLNDTKIKEKEYTKSKVLSDLITLGVDNENLLYLEKLNINPETYNFVTGMVMHGYDAELITYIINQPIIRDYVRLMSKVKDNNLKYNKKMLAEELANKYANFGKFNATRENNKNKRFNFIDTLFIDLDKKSENNQLALYNYYKKFNKKDLAKNIKNRKNYFLNDSSEFHEQQAVILHSFISLTGTFSPLNKLQEALNIDGQQGIGNTLLYTKEKENQLDAVVKEEVYISNSSNLLYKDIQLVEKSNIKDNQKDYVIIEENENTFKIGKPNSMQGVLFNTLKFINKNFNSEDMFIYNSDLFENFDLLFKEFFYRENNKDKLNTKQKEKFSKEAFSTFKTYLFTSFYNKLFNNNIQEERKRLFIQDKENISFPNILNDIKNNSNLFKNNFLLQSLDIINGNEYDIGDIKYNVQDKQNEALFVNDNFTQLLFDDTVYYNKNGVIYRGKDVALDLLRFFTLKSNFNSKFNFISLLDHNIFTSIGITDSLKEFKPYNLEAKQVTEEIENFLIQYVQHNKDNSVVKNQLNFEPNHFTEIEKDKFLSKDKVVPNIFIFNGEIFYNYETVNNEHIILKIPSVGDSLKNINEYDRNKKFISKSIMPFNDQEKINERLHNSHNLSRLNEYLNNNFVVTVKFEDSNLDYTVGVETKAEYLKIKKYAEENAKSFELNSYIDAENYVNILKINDFKLKDGLATIVLNNSQVNKIKNFDENLVLNSEATEGEKIIYEDRKKQRKDEEKKLIEKKEKEEKESLELTSEIIEFNETFEITNNIEESLENILNTIKTNEKGDLFKNYLLDILKNNLSRIIENNPDIKLNIINDKNNNGNAWINKSTSDKKIISLNINVAHINSLFKNENNAKEDGAFSDVLIEEFLHLFTIDAMFNDNSVLNELEKIRKDYIESLPNKDKEGIEKVKKKIKRYSIINNINNKSNNKEEIFSNYNNLTKEQKELLKPFFNSIKDKENINLLEEFNNFYSFDENFLSDEELEYYGLSNIHEFTARLFKNKKLQENLNKKKSKSKKTLYDRFMSLLYKIFNRLADTNKWNRLFEKNVNKNSLLEDSINKTFKVISQKEKLNKSEKDIIYNNLNKKNISIHNLKVALGLQHNNTLYPIENAKAVAKELKENINDINIKVIKGKYIAISDEEIFENEYDFKKEENKKEQEKSLEQKSINLKNSFLDKRGTDLISGSLVKNNQNKYFIFIDDFEFDYPYITDEKGKKTFIKDEKEFLKNHFVQGLYSTENYDNETYVLTDKSLIQTKTGAVLKKDKNLELYENVLNNRKEEDNDLTEDSFNFSIKGNTQEAVNKERKNRLNILRTNRIKKLENNRDIAKGKGNDKKYRLINSLIKRLKENDELIKTLSSLEDLAELAKRDLEEVKSILNSPDYEDSDTVYVKKVISNWKDVYNLYFTDEEYERMAKTVDEFGLIINEANRLDRIMHRKNEKFFQDGIKERFDKEIDLRDYFDDFEDISSLDKYGYDISRFNNTLLNYIHSKNVEAFSKTKIESFDKLQNINKLIDDILPILSNFSDKENGKFSIFFQKYSDGTTTGDMVSPFSKEFLMEKEKAIKKLSSATDKIEASEEFNKWLLKNTEYFNAFLLFKNNDKKFDKDKKEHIEKLKDILGEGLYNHFYNQQQKLVENYEKDKSEKLKTLLLDADLDKEKDDKNSLKENAPLLYNEMVLWEAENSPYIHYYQVNEKKYKKVKLLDSEGAVKEEVDVFNEGYKYLINVPKNNDNYDKNFEIILNNEKLLSFYNSYRDIMTDLSKYLPENIKRKIAFNGLPDIKKTFIEAISQEGISESGKFLYNTFIEQITSAEENEIDNQEIDTVSGEESRSLKFNLINNNYKDYETFYDFKVKEAIAKDIPTNTYEFEASVKKEFNNKMSKRRSKDLGKMLKAYVGLSLTYKHKSRIQDTLLAGEIFINNLEERDRTITGNKKFTKHIDAKLKPNNVAYANLKEVYKQYLRTFFDNPYAKEMVLKKKILTTSQLKNIKKYNNLKGAIEQKLYALDALYEEGEITLLQKTEQKNILNNELKELDELIENEGSNFTTSKFVDGILKYTQLKGMGWNIMAGIGNLGFGYTSLLSEAADGRILSRKDILDAMKLSMNSVARNGTFNKWGGVNNLGIKIRNLMDRNDVLKEASHELYANSVKGTFAKKLRFLHPYNLQKRTEYLVQSPIMIAFYKTKKIKINGEEVSLWEAYKDDGQWNTEKYGKEPIKFITEVNTEITQMIKRVHGNYDPSSPMLVKHKVLGRALVQFKSWIFEGYSRRWGKYDFDDILKTDYQGFYRSVPTFFKDNNASYFKSTIDLFKAVTFNMVSVKTSFNKDGIDDLTAANMRRLVEELTLMLRMFAMYYLLKLLLGGDDEDEKMALNNSLNIINNVNSELQLYVNPIKLKNLLSNPIPAMGVVSDLYRVYDSTKKSIKGEPVIEQGNYAGENRINRSLRKVVPFLTMYEKLNVSSKTVLSEIGMN